MEDKNKRELEEWFKEWKKKPGIRIKPDDKPYMTEEIART